MPDSLDDLLGDNAPGTDSGQSGKGLRAQLEAALAQKAAAEAELATYRTNERQRSVADLFAKHAIPELAKDLFPADAVPTDEAATALIAKYGSLWGAQAQAATTTAADQAATSAAQQFASQANAAPVTPLSEEAYRQKLAAAQSPDELMQLINELSATADAVGPGF